ncbi:MAG: hypothetical protein KGQ58_09255 [Proteobacteria bacterium]|nr:hypothetical protein [Pseudomonadota bacterium]
MKVVRLKITNFRSIKSAELHFADRPSGPFSATFRSLPAILLSGLALRNKPEIRKGRKSDQYRSMSYIRTNQEVGLRHWVAEGTTIFAFRR